MALRVKVRRPERRTMGQLDLEVIRPDIEERRPNGDLTQIGPEVDLSVVEPSGDVVGPDITEVGGPEITGEPGIWDKYKVPIIGGIAVLGVVGYLALRKK